MTCIAPVRVVSMSEAAYQTLRNLESVVVGDRTQVDHGSVPLNKCVLPHHFHVALWNLHVRARLRHHSFPSVPYGEVSVFRL
jgi:hypothetical protein